MTRTTFHYRDPTRLRYDADVASTALIGERLLLRSVVATTSMGPHRRGSSRSPNRWRARRRRYSKRRGLTIASFTLFGTFSSLAGSGRFANVSVVRFVVPRLPVARSRLLDVSLPATSHWSSASLRAMSSPISTVCHRGTSCRRT